ncbi:MAG: glutathione S-transferase family protein [Myxococcota bacterium]
MKLYGVAQSRAQRSLWMLEELGIDYEHEKTHFATDAKQPEYLENINPNGKVPALVDGDLVLWESMAINLYLARKYDGGLLPKSLEDQARAVQWSFWGMTEIEPSLIEVLMNRRFLPEDQRDAAKADAAEAALAKPLAVLNEALVGEAYLLGSSFSVADLNVASVLSWALFLGVELSQVPEVQRWLGACTSRPAAERASAL